MATTPVCYRCGKIFKRRYDLTRHLNNKKPCKRLEQKNSTLLCQDTTTTNKNDVNNSISENVELSSGGGFTTLINEDNAECLFDTNTFQDMHIHQQVQ